MKILRMNQKEMLEIIQKQKQKTEHCKRNEECL